MNKVCFSNLKEILDKILLKNIILNPERDFFISDYQLGDGSKINPMRICFSSKFLIKHLKNQKSLNNNTGLIGIDGTYKLTNLCYPFLVLTTIDLRNKIHPIAFCITNSEDKESYDYFIYSIKKSYYPIEKEEYRP